MKLSELLGMVNENDAVNVYNPKMESVGVADGKDTVPEYFLSCEVVAMHPADFGQLNVEIALEGGSCADILFRSNREVVSRVSHYRNACAHAEQSGDRDLLTRLTFKMYGFLDALKDMGHINREESHRLLDYMEGRE